MSAKAPPRSAESILRHLAGGEPLRVADYPAQADELASKGLIRLDDGVMHITPAGRYSARTEATSATISVTLSDGTTTGHVPMEAVREALDTMKGNDRRRRKAPPVKETLADKAVSEKAYQITADELRQFIERFEQLDAEKKDVAGQQKELMSEAKGRGYDTKVMRKIVALRKRKPDDIAEEEAVLDMYKAALGMA